MLNSLMRQGLAFLLCLLFVGCSPADESKHDQIIGESAVERRRGQIMDEIERQVALPAGAYAFDAYARVYTELPGGGVVGQYSHNPTERVSPGARAWVEYSKFNPGFDDGCETINIH